MQLELNVEINVADAQERTYKAAVESSSLSSKVSGKKTKPIDNPPTNNIQTPLHTEAAVVTKPSLKVSVESSKSDTVCARPKIQPDDRAVKSNVNHHDSEKPCRPPLNSMATEFKSKNDSHFQSKNTSDAICDLLQQGQKQQRDIVDVLQLPKAELHTFDGNPLKYWQFIKAFENSVARVTNDANAKLTRLIQYCSGKALQVIEFCSVMPPEQGFARAMNILSDRFGNNYVISEAWFSLVTRGKHYGQTM